jgi:predicted RNA-binding Zn ribbon-like protein
MSDATGFPRDWLDSRAGHRGTDLDLAVLLVNSQDALADPSDRLHDLHWLTQALTSVGHGRVAGELTRADLPGLRLLRERLRAVFEALDEEQAAARLNPLLREADAVPLLVTRSSDAPEHSTPLWLDPAAGRRGLDRLQASLPAALAQHVVEMGVRRLGTCASDPCHCAFVDRTRAGTRRYCCSYCNDRAAARAYRKRRVHGNLDLSDKSD